MRPRWERYANAAFPAGHRVAVSRSRSACRGWKTSTGSCCPLTGFQAKAVSGYVPAFLFFDCLRNREFPTTITIRRSDKLDYLPEPDIFHDIAGHVPMHTDPAFRGNAGAVWRMRAHGGRTGGGDSRRARREMHGSDQHHQGDGPILLVHGGVRADARGGAGN